MTQSTNSAVQDAGLERQVGASSINYPPKHARSDNKVASVPGEQTNAGDSHESPTQAKTLRQTFKTYGGGFCPTDRAHCWVGTPESIESYSYFSLGERANIGVLIKVETISGEMEARWTWELG